MDWDTLRLRNRPATRGNRCRCGSRIPAGSPCLEFEGVPESLSSLLRDQAFCTPACVRAYLLEAMEVLEGAAAPELIGDVHSVYSYLQVLFALAQKDQLPNDILAPSTD